MSEAVAVQAGIRLAERAARYACEMGTLRGLFVAASTGALGFVSDPDKFIDDMQQATWRAMTWPRWPGLSGAAHELEFYGGAL